MLFHKFVKNSFAGKTSSKWARCYLSSFLYPLSVNTWVLLQNYYLLLLSAASEPAGSSYMYVYTGIHTLIRSKTVLNSETFGSKGFK